MFKKIKLCLLLSSRCMLHCCLKFFCCSSSTAFINLKVNIHPNKIFLILCLRFNNISLYLAISMHACMHACVISVASWFLFFCVFAADEFFKRASAYTRRKGLLSSFSSSSSCCCCCCCCCYNCYCCCYSKPTR